MKQATTTTAETAATRPIDASCDKKNYWSTTGTRTEIYFLLYVGISWLITRWLMPEKNMLDVCQAKKSY